MFDDRPYLSPIRSGEKNLQKSTSPLDPAALAAFLSGLSASELEALEDDLDFAHFSGGLTPRLAELVAEITETGARKAA